MLKPERPSHLAANLDSSMRYLEDIINIIWRIVNVDIYLHTTLWQLVCSTTTGILRYIYVLGECICTCIVCTM